MERNILSLIEKAKNDSSYFEELSQLLQIDVSEVSYFLRQFLFFEILSYNDVLNYVNYFRGLNIFSYELNIQHKQESFIKCLFTFITEKMKGRKGFLISIKNKNAAEVYIEVIKLLPKRDEYTFKIDRIAQMNINVIIELFKLIQNVEIYKYFSDKFDLIIENLLEINFIPFIMIFEETIDLVIEYSKRYPNRIQKFQIEGCIKKIKIKELINLNKESLLSLPNGDPKYLLCCPKIKELMFTKIPPRPTPEILSNFDFTQITKFSIRNINITQKNKNKVIDILLSYLNLCPNITYVYYDLGDDTTIVMFILLMNYKYHNITEIVGNLWTPEEGIDLDPIIQKFPNLISIKVYNQESSTMLNLDSVAPIFKFHNVELDFPNLVKLCRNYLNSQPLEPELIFYLEDSSFFFEYFQNKKDLLNSIIFTQDVNCDLQFDFCLKCYIMENDGIQFYSHFKKIDLIYLFDDDINMENAENILDIDEMIKLLRKVKPNVLFYQKKNLEPMKKILDSKLKNILITNWPDSNIFYFNDEIFITETK